MLNICGSIGESLDIIFNGMKSNCLKIGPSDLKPSEMMINGSDIKWESRIKYLGVYIVEGKRFNVDLSYCKRAFFTSVNSVLNSARYMSDLIKLELCEKMCLPLLLYCAESLFFCTKQMNDMNSWWNSVYRKIFSYNRWESVKPIIAMLNRLDLRHILYLKTIKFLKMLKDNGDVMLSTFYHISCNDIIPCRLSVCIADMSWSYGKIKHTVTEDFKNKHILLM